MSSPRPFEMQLLGRTQDLLSAFSQRYSPNQVEARFQALEAAAARMGTHDLAAFHKVFGHKTIAPISTLMKVGAELVAEVEKCGIPPALALSALARESLEDSQQRSTGAYHTDFRLAQRVAKLAAPGLNESSRVIDVACGAGILIAALTMEVCGPDRKKTAAWFRNSVFAADLSEVPLRGALISLAALTDDMNALAEMRSHWVSGDSLLMDDQVWSAMAPDGFDAIVANPPWEKVRITKHEFMKATGDTRHYGADTSDIDVSALKNERERVASYSQKLTARYPIIAQGEPDLYMAFLDLHLKLLRPGGKAAILVPGGLIRSQGTKAFRRKILQEASDISVSVLDNKARFFSIDTRFKFLAVALTKAKSARCRRTPIKLLHESGTDTGLVAAHSATIGRSTLAKIRSDLTVPEVKSDKEWTLFRKLNENGVRIDRPGSQWQAEFCRELDMTNDRPSFLSKRSPGTMPVIEGRQLNQHRFGVKGYVSGSGRSAVWSSFQVGSSRVASQFYIPRAACSERALARSGQVRAGFCDIAGQTNERSMMAALVPAGVACGNKVPTVLFPNDPSEDRLLVWLAIVNSFTFDWMLRRVLTTTINYFVLQGIPLPNIAKGGVPWRRIVGHTKELVKLDSAGANDKNWQRIGWLRTQIDIEVALAYGATLDDLTLMLDDFPLLDRAQASLPNEKRSTFTRDMLLAAASKRLRSSRGPKQRWAKRVDAATLIGAYAYIPSEIGVLGEDAMGDNRARE